MRIARGNRLACHGSRFPWAAKKPLVSSAVQPSWHVGSDPVSWLYCSKPLAVFAETGWTRLNQGFQPSFQKDSRHDIRS